MIERATVFARVSPEHKVRIVSALQRAGHTVAMTGDGNNDAAAAIRSADVGIGIAARGSTAARNAADLVLAHADTTVLLDALAQGRGMWRSVHDAVGILVGGNTGEVTFTLLGTALIGRAPVGTRQFLLINLLTDMFPAMAVALSRTGAAGATPPRAPDDPAARAAAAGAQLAAMPRPELGHEMLKTVIVRGACTAAGATAAWSIGRVTGTRRRASTIGLAALVGAQLGQTLLTTWRSPIVWVTTLASAAALTAVIMTPGLSGFFGCVPLDPLAWATVLACSAAATAGAAALARLRTGVMV